MLVGKRVLLIISGGISAYKSLDLIRRLQDQRAKVRCVLTAGGAHFVTPLSVAALSGGPVFQDLFSLKDESEIGHIRLSREADIVVVAPATANLLARMAAGLADDLASTVLLATDKPVLVAPAMNVRMWQHPATRANMVTLQSRGVMTVGPEDGTLACGETGEGRMADVADIIDTITKCLALPPRGESLKGRHALVTSGPTLEPIDPVRYIGNRSSGKQGHAIAAALAGLGATVTLVTGPTVIPDPPDTQVVRVETALEMLAACRAALPADIVVCAAAVADWRVVTANQQKLKKNPDMAPPTLVLTLNPDILRELAAPRPERPALVVGFAAETEYLLTNAAVKRAAKNCDWIVANDVSQATGTFGGDDNLVHLVTDTSAEPWPRMSKVEVAVRLAERIAAHFSAKNLT